MKKKYKDRKGYFDYEDIDFEIDVPSFGKLAVDDMIYYNDLKNRKLFLDSDVDQCSAREIVQNIMRFNRDDRENGLTAEERDPIMIYISSNGGEVDAGFSIIDAIRLSKTPVYTINIGYAYSMAFLIMLAGHKRFATQNAKFLHHDGTNVIINSATKAKDQMEFNDKIEKRVKDYVVSRTKVTEEEYKAHMRQEWYLFADEAKEYGMTDYVVGEDCELDDVI